MQGFYLVSYWMNTYSMGVGTGGGGGGAQGPGPPLVCGTLSELIHSRGRPISKSPVSEGASSSSQSGSSGGSFVLALALALITNL